MLELIDEHDIDPANVERVDVGTNHNMPNALIHHQPETELQAKFSMEFCLSILLLERREFNERNEVHRGLAEVLACFDPNIVDDWTVSGWLVARQRGLQGRSIVEWLASGRPHETVVRLARAQASRYAA